MLGVERASVRPACSSWCHLRAPALIIFWPARQRLNGALRVGWLWLA